MEEQLSLSSSIMIVSSPSRRRRCCCCRRRYRFPTLIMIRRGWNDNILLLLFLILTTLFFGILLLDNVVVIGVSAFVPIRYGTSNNNNNNNYYRRRTIINNNIDEQPKLTTRSPNQSFLLLLQKNNKPEQQQSFVLFATTKSSLSSSSKQQNKKNGFGGNGGFGGTSSTSSSKTTKKNNNNEKQQSNSSSSSSSSVASEPQQQQQSQTKLRSISGKQMGMGNKAFRDAVNTYDTLRKINGAENCSYDVYIRSPKNDPNLFWFVGKVALDIANAPDGVTIVDACLAQKRIIMEYSKLHLRPQNFGGVYATTLELWYVPEPGDKEMDIVQNKVLLRQVVGNAQSIHPNFIVDMCGYNPEIYLGDEQTQGGLRVKRNTDGTPIDPIFDVYAGQ